MNIHDEFRVTVPVEEAWAVLLDVERIAPCMPGAQLQEVEGDEYRGIVRVKVGPITAQYKGAARIVETDEAAHRIVLKAEGRDTRGQGNASATVTAVLTPDGDGTQVSIDTDLSVTGKVAQFGRGVMADVSSKLLKQFAQSLEADVLSGSSAAAEPPTTPSPPAQAGESGAEAPPSSPPPAQAKSSAPTGAPPRTESEKGVRRIESAESEPVDLMKAAGGAVAKRLIPVAVVLLVLVALVVWLLTK